MKPLAIRSVILVTVITVLAAVLAAGVAGEEQGLVNPGFESGALDHWNLGFVPGTGYVDVLDGDSFRNHVYPSYSTGMVTVEPREGDYMARVGRPDATLGGVAEIYQDFEVPSAGVADFSYKMCTYDGWNEDYFAYRVTLVDVSPAVEVVFHRLSTPDGYAGGDVWCGDWTDVSIDLTKYERRLARFMVSAGDGNGSRATWAYVDAPLPAVVPEPEPEPDPEGDALSAVVDVKPETLNLGTAEGDGALTVFLELPAGLSLNDVDSDSVVLSVNGSEFRPDTAGNGFGDYDGDGVPDRMFKFRRAATVAAVGSASDRVTFTLAGEVDGVPFAGLDTVRVLQKSALVNRVNSKAK